MDEQKFNSIISYYKDLNIEVPVAVQNALQDVFEENDNIEDVESYFLEDLPELKKEMHLRTDAKMFLNGNNSGSMTDTWTYYGGVEFTVDETVALYNDDGTELEKIVNATTQLDGEIYDITDWAVLLFETVSWDTSVSNIAVHGSPKLIIFCPKTIDDEDEGNYGE